MQKGNNLASETHDVEIFHAIPRSTQIGLTVELCLASSFPPKESVGLGSQQLVHRFDQSFDRIDALLEV